MPPGEDSGRPPIQTNRAPTPPTPAPAGLFTSKRSSRDAARQNNQLPQEVRLREATVALKCLVSIVTIVGLAMALSAMALSAMARA